MVFDFNTIFFFFMTIQYFQIEIVLLLVFSQRTSSFDQPFDSDYKTNTERIIKMTR